MTTPPERKTEPPAATRPVARGTTRFTERMVGPVALLPPVDCGVVDLPARGEVLGDDIVRAARAAACSCSVPRAASPLDVFDLTLDVEPLSDLRRGFRAGIAGGRVAGLGATLDGPIVAGYADLLHRTAPGERRMYYRLVTGGCRSDGREGWQIVEGVKVIDGSVLSSWRHTTTLFARVSRIDDGPAARAVLAAPDARIDGAEPVSAGVLRILPRDLAHQVLSMRGDVPRFLAGFGRLLLDRR